MISNEFYSHFIDEEKEAEGGQVGTLGYKLFISASFQPQHRFRILYLATLRGPSLVDLGILNFRPPTSTLARMHAPTHLVKWKQQDSTQDLPESTLTNIWLPGTVGHR